MAVKCRDVSIEGDVNAQGQVERESAAIHAIRDTECKHLLHHSNLVRQDLSFKLEGYTPTDRGHSLWKLHYAVAEYTPHGDLHQLIKNHEESKT